LMGTLSTQMQTLLSVSDHVYTGCSGILALFELRWRGACLPGAVLSVCWGTTARARGAAADAAHQAAWGGSTSNTSNTSITAQPHTVTTCGHSTQLST
jgi:hypothetical protein